MSGTRIGFVGLGMMGAPMARRLAQAGFELVLSDADPERAGTLCRDLRARPLSGKEAAGLDVLITMLPNSAVVEEVLLGGTGGGSLADALPSGATVIDMSSSEPVRSRALGETLAARGLGYLDAPVSGGVRRAVDGSLAILVGGDASCLARHRPVLEAMGRSILHIGAAGAGHAAKALNNFVSAAGLIATVEALHVAARFGIDPQVMTDVLNASTGRNNTSENKVKPFMLSGSYASGFSLALMDKDLGIADDLARSVGYPLAFGRHGIALWHAVAERAGPASDHTEMYRFLADETDMG